MTLKAENATNQVFQDLLQAGIVAATNSDWQVDTTRDWRTTAIAVMEHHPNFPAGGWCYRGGHHVAIILNQECCGQIVEFTLGSVPTAATAAVANDTTS